MTLVFLVQLRIPRAEVEELGQIVIDVAHKLEPGLKLIIGGKSLHLSSYVSFCLVGF